MPRVASGRESAAKSASACHSRSRPKTGEGFPRPFGIILKHTSLKHTSLKHGSAEGRGMRPSSLARATASVRLAAPSLPRRWLTCFFTVSRVTKNFWLAPHFVKRLAHLGWGFVPSISALGLATSFDHDNSPVSVHKTYDSA